MTREAAPDTDGTAAPASEGWIAGERPEDGAMRRVGDLYQLRFVRHLQQPVETVWAALTEPERIADWLGQPTRLDLRVGGLYVVRFVGAPNDDGIYGTITEYDPPRLLAYDWNDTGGNTSLRWELSPQGDGCRLVFTQTGLNPWWFIGGFAGWHAMLDELEPRLPGGPPAADDGESYRALDARYRAWFSPHVEGFDVRPALRHNEPDGLVMDAGDGLYDLRFVRRYMLPIETVWAALTEPARLADWFAQAKVDLKPGGAVTFRWEAQGSAARGVISELDPPRVMAWTMEEADGSRSVVRWHLTQEDPDFMGTRLVLTQTRLRGDHLLSVASGWHAHLDELPDAAARATSLAWTLERETARSRRELERLVPRYRGLLPRAAAEGPGGIRPAAIETRGL